MSDIAITWDTANFRGDWSVSNGDLTTGSDLQTAVLVSLFTDGRAPDDYQPTDGTNDRRGWWADTYAADGDQIGSLLWTLMRSKKTSQQGLLNQARDYCLQALQWLLDDGVAASVSVATGWVTPTLMGISVTITKPTGAAANMQFQYVWAGV